MKSGSSEYSRRVLNDIRMLSADEVRSIHGIRINEDKTVFDESYNQTFATVDEWLAFSEDDDADSVFEKFSYDGTHYS